MRYLQKHKCSAFICFIICLLLSCAPRVNRWGFPQSEYTYRVPEKVDDGWEAASLIEGGVNSEIISSLMHNILAGKFSNIHSVLIVRNGKLVFEEYFYGYDRETKHELRSASKSVVSILVGIAIDQNMLSGVDRMAHEFFPEYQGTKWIDQPYEITLKDLLTMTAGLEWDEWSYPYSDPRSSVYKIFRNTDNWEKNIFNLDHVTPAGEQFAYNSMLTHLLGQITEKAAGMNMVKFAEENLFTPMGIKEYTWEGPPWSTGLSLRPRDMAKIGYLFLRQGIWGRKQIVSTEWVQESTKSRVKAFFGGSEYGYQWWRGKAATDNQIIHTYYAAGRGGQYIFVVPQLDVVVVFTSQALNNSPDGELYPHVIMTEHIIPAIVPQSVPRKMVASVPMVCAQYVGEYHFIGRLKLTVIKEADDIYLMTFDGEKVELTPIADDRFYGKLEDIGNVEIRFHKNERGEVTNLDYNIGFAHLPFDKIK